MEQKEDIYGISFDKEKQEVSIWIGFGITNKKQDEIIQLTKQYINRYYMIEPELNREFKFSNNFTSGIIIVKNIKIENVENESIKADILYLSDLYKKYEKKFENAIIDVEEKDIIKNDEKEMELKEINKRMLEIIEEIGKLAEVMKKLL